MNCSNKKPGLFYSLLLVSFFLIISCGYHMTGSKLLPFNSITIKPVQNKTYEPRLEERMHNALSNEFINQGIEVKSSGGNVELQATVINFQIGAIAAVDEKVKEQEIIMHVDIKLIDKGRITEFKSMRSPIKITFESAGLVAESVANKEQLTNKASREIAREIIGQIIMRYAK